MQILFSVLLALAISPNFAATPDQKAQNVKTTTEKCDLDASTKIFNRCSRLIENYMVALRLYTLPVQNESESDLEKRFRNAINYFCGFVNAINTCTLLIRQLCEMPVVDNLVREFDDQSRNLRQASDSYCQAHNYARVNFGCLAGIQATIDAQCKRKLKPHPRQTGTTPGNSEVDPECATSIEYFLECNRYVARTLCGKASGDARASLVMLSVLKLIHPAQNPCASEKDPEMLAEGAGHDSAEDDVEGDVTGLNEPESDMEWMDLGEESFYMPKQHDTIYITRFVPVFGKDDPIAQEFASGKEGGGGKKVPSGGTTIGPNGNNKTKAEDEGSSEHDEIIQQTKSFHYAEDEGKEEDELELVTTTKPSLATSKEAKKDAPSTTKSEPPITSTISTPKTSSTISTTFDPPSYFHTLIINIAKPSYQDEEYPREKWTTQMTDLDSSDDYGDGQNGTRTTFVITDGHGDDFYNDTSSVKNSFTTLILTLLLPLLIDF